MNGDHVGRSGNHSFVFVDRDPGSYKVSIEVPLSIGHYSTDVPVRAGSTTYVAVARA